MGGAHVQSTDADALEPATPSTASARFQAVVVCRDASANPLRSVGGITLLERLLRQLSELETVESILLLKPIDLSLPTPSKRVRKDVIYQDTSGTTVWEMLRGARAHLRDRFILVAADLLIDQRLLSWLTAQTTDVILSPRIGDRPETAAFLRAKSLDAPNLEAAHINVVEVASLPTYWEAMHGDVPLHLQRISERRRCGTGLADSPGLYPAADAGTARALFRSFLRKPDCPPSRTECDHRQPGNSRHHSLGVPGGGVLCHGMAASRGSARNLRRGARRRGRQARAHHAHHLESGRVRAHSGFLLRELVVVGVGVLSQQERIEVRVACGPSNGRVRFSRQHRLFGRRR